MASLARHKPAGDEGKGDARIAPEGLQDNIQGCRAPGTHSIAQSNSRIFPYRPYIVVKLPQPQRVQPGSIWLALCWKVPYTDTAGSASCISDLKHNNLSTLHHKRQSLWLSKV